jgi:dipeptidyl aminopeptidase/acylaminoacyl peptidase
MRRLSAILVVTLLPGCAEQAAQQQAAPSASQTPPPTRSPGRSTAGGTTTPATLVEARRGFTTKLTPSQPGDAIPDPPPAVFRRVNFDSPVGKLAAYLTPDPGDGQKHPAIIWITGGDCNSIGEVWEKADRKNDQTAASYREAGIIMMFPSLRGGNHNPGQREGFFGEVDDVLAAADFLIKQPYVDPQRVYLGGHSTGGTLVMLVAESSDRFRAAFAFGPVHDVRGYGGDYAPFDHSNPEEYVLRAPARWLGSVRSPLFVIEGADQPSNGQAVQLMARLSKNPQIQILLVPGYSHFSILAPANDLIAAKLLADTGPATNIAISAEEMAAK